MPNDATFELLADLQNKQKAAIAMVAAPIYNIDDMDPKFCMINLMFSGCYCLVATKTIDPARPGMIYIDGAQQNRLDSGKNAHVRPGHRHPLSNTCTNMTTNTRSAMLALMTPTAWRCPIFFTLKTLPNRTRRKVSGHDAIVLQAARKVRFC